MAKGTIYKKIERDLKDKFVKDINAILNKRINELKSLHDDYPLKLLNVRENEINTIRNILVSKYTHFGNKTSEEEK